MGDESHNVNHIIPEVAGFALRVVREFLGELPEKLCRILVERGPSPLQEICKASGLTRKDVKNGLIALVQLNYVSVLLHEEILGPTRMLSEYIYRVDPHRIVLVPRHPKYLLYAADTLGEWAERTIEVLLEQGRLPFDALVQYLVSRMDLPEGEVIQRAAGTIVQLMSARFIEQVPPCDMPLEFEPEKVRGKSRARGASASDRIKSDQALSVAQYKKMRYKLPHAVMRANVHVEGAAPMDTSAGGGDGDGADDVVLLRVNATTFQCHLIHQKCVDLMDSKCGKDARLVTKVLLKQSRQLVTDPTKSVSEYIALQQLQKQVDLLRAADPEDDLSESLEEVLHKAMLEDLIIAGPSDTFALNISAAMSMVKLQALSGYMKHRFGQRGLRIWRLLIMQPHLQAEHIEKEAMMGTRDTRTLVYAMFRAGYIRVQEIPKSMEHAPSKTIYTYHTDFFRTQNRLVSDLYRSCNNVLARSAFEMERRRAILELASRQFRGDSIKMSSSQLQAAARLQSVIKVLQVKLLELDEMLLEMHCHFVPEEE